MDHGNKLQIYSITYIRDISIHFQTIRKGVNIVTYIKDEQLSLGNLNFWDKTNTNACLL